MRFKVILLAVLIGIVTPPTASALPPCLIQNLTYTFPSSSVRVGQQVTVQTHLQATCVQWPPYAVAYSIRVDLTDMTTGVVPSTVTYQVGYSQTYIDQVFVNTATAPNHPGFWMLRVDVYLWGGESGQLIIHAADYAKLPVE